MLLLSLLATGCANSPGNSTQPGAAPAPASPAPSSSDVVDLPQPSSKKPGGANASTVTGTVSAGVEPNCLLLQGESGSHLLIFEEPSLRSLAKVGDKVTVTGRADPDMMSTCQQGTPFVVSAVRPG